MKKVTLFVLILFAFLFSSSKTFAATATLNNLTISAGTLSPAFDNNTFAYTVKESDVTGSVTVRPTRGTNGQTIKVNNITVGTNTDSDPITLTPGSNTITITVKNGATTDTYKITVIKEDINYAGSPFTYYTGAAIATTSSTETGDTNPTYSGTLPAGLLLNTANGNITGTPTTASAATNYTITASYGGGITATATVNIQVITPAISYTGSPFTFYQGTPISALPVITTGAVPTSYSGTLPAGLTLNTTNGNITGTPTTVSASPLNYTITANYAGGIPAQSTTISIKVLAPTISYTGSPYIFFTGAAIPALTPTVTGIPASYTITPALSAGLSFNTTTGVVSGTPAATAPLTVYTIKANYAGGVTASTTIALTVNLGPPIISYTPSTNVYAVGVPITTLTPVNTGGATTSFIIGPALPAGLTFNNATGAISGTPTAVSGTNTYTITASNGGGSGSTTITLTVNPPPPIISYTPSTVTYTVGTAITPLTPGSTGGPAVSYSIGPALPAGLTLNTITGVISGTPTAEATAANYTITATNASGSATATVNITVLPIAPAISYIPATNVYTVGTAITPLTPVNIGGPSTNYIIGPSLPAGLTFNIHTGVISGTPLATSPATIYTVSAENDGGLSTTTVTISCVNPVPPVISYSPSNQVYVVGTATGSWNPTNTGGAAESYSISGPLPDGLLFNTATGAITGTPTTVTSITSYTVTATNSAGSGTATIKITVNAQAPSITYNPLSNTYTKGTTITPLTPINSGGTPTGYAITSGSLPAGLTFNTSTGVISGTPTVISFTGNVTITATNVSGNAQVVLTISVNNLGPSISYSPAINLFPVGAPITPLIPTSTGGVPSSYAITSGTLPAGLSFNTSTGVISGTPTVESAAPVNLTIKGTNATGSNSATVQITVSPHAPVISYTPSTNVYSVNVPIATLTPANAGGAVLGYAYSSNGTKLTGATLGGPSLMTIDANGNIYVANWNSNVNTIVKYGPSGNYIGTFGPTNRFANPEGLVFDSAGNCYVLDTGNSGAIYKLDANGNYISTIVTGLGHPLGIAIDGSNNIFVASYDSNNVSSVIKYNTSGTQLFALNNSNMNQADGVATDAAGNIYVLNRGTNLPHATSAGYVEKYAPDGTDLGVFASGFNDPLAISIDPGGNVFVADSHNDQIEVYNSSGGLLNTLTGFNDVEGFVADANGNLYVSDFTKNTVQEYAAQGGYHISAPLPPGLNFNSATGQITGTPTSTFPTTTYTITAYNVTGSGSTTVTLSCANSYDWVGTTSTDWNTPSNWLSGVVPGSNDQAIIGVNKAFNFYPNILAAAGTVNVGSIILGNLGGKAPGIVVNSGTILNVSGAITYQTDANSNLGYTGTLSGAGTINAGGITVTASTLLGASYAHQLTASIGILNISGNVSLTSYSSGSKLFNSTFTITGGSATLLGIVQTVSTTGSTTSFVVAPTSTTTLQLNNTAALSGLAGSGTNVITFNNPGTTIQYSGAAQTIYTDASITGLSAGVSYQSLKISGTGIKTALTGNLNITGNFTNNLANDASNYIDFSNTTVNFNGTVQTLTPGLNATSGTTFYNVNFSGAGTKTIVQGQMYIASSGVLTMVGNNASTVLAASGLLTLNSDATGSASVAAINGPSITGNVNVQRYISGGRRGYRMLSSPVFAGTAGSNNVYSVNYLQLSSYLSGSAGGGFDKVGNPTIYLFRQDLVPSSANFTAGNWWGITAINNSPAYNYTVSGVSASGNYYLPVGNGFLFFYRGNRATGTLAQETQTTYTNPDPVTLTATGKLNQGQVMVHYWLTPTSTSLPYTGSGTGTNYAVRGSTIVGNPYASSIDWEQSNTTSTTTGIYTQNLATTIWEFNPRTYNYDVYQKGGIYTNHGRRTIVSGEGFAVLVLNNTISGQLIFNESAKSVAQSTGLDLFMDTKSNLINLANSNINQHLRLQMAADTVNTDDIYIGFDPGAKPEYDINEDAETKNGYGTIGLGSYSSDHVLLAINKMPFPGLSQSVIPLNVSAASAGSYKLNLTEQVAIPQLFEIYLKDNFKKDSVNIRKDTTYSFDITADTNTYGSKRFQIVLRQDTSLSVKLLSFTGVKANHGSQLQWETQNEENYTHFTIERSSDGGVTYNVIGGLASTGAATYSFLDRAPAIAADKYRLKMEDLNGTITYSNIVTLMYANTGGLTNNPVSLYPNPAVSTINLSINLPFNSGTTSNSNAAYAIKIVNATGAIIKTAAITENNWQTSVSSLMPGTYILQVTDSNKNVYIGKATFVKL